MDIVISQDYATAASSNALHNRSRDRWIFLHDSYVGGNEYKRGGYLTRYQLESEGEYAQRAAVTPLDNQCRSIIATYISFMFRLPPQRTFGNLESEPTLPAFLEDCDWEGRDLDSFMKQAAIYANIFGHTWIVMSKPDVGAVTRADEMAQNVRPYLNLITPLAVTDWKWSRRLNGSYELAYLKYVEDTNDTTTVIKEWTKELVVTSHLDHENEVIADRLEELNGLGMIPAVIMYAHTSSVRGLGLSTISDIADAQKFIFNMTSEAEQAVRLGSHPSLVKTKETNAGSGAGSIIEMPEHMDPNLKPYVLEFNGQEISSIYTAINSTISSIDKMANTGSIRATETTVMSGVSREVEFQLLNARLSEQADNIELAEEQLWKLYAAYQGTNWDGVIEYPNSFAIRDTANELDQLIKVYDKVQDPAARTAIENELLELVDVEVEEVTIVPQTLAAAQAELDSEDSINGCPIAVMDKATNIANHLICIEEANLGPANPVSPNVFWIQRADRLGITPAESVKQTCSNCAQYMNTSAIKSCFATSAVAGTLPLATEVNSTWTNTNDAAAYCLQWDITCTASRTCDTWVPGGPVTDNWQGTN